MSHQPADPPTPAAPAAPPPLDERTVFRSLFTASPDGLLLVDARGAIVLANPAAAQLLGYAPDELAGLPVDALVPAASRAQHAAYRAGYARDPRPRPMGMQRELRALRRDGSEVSVEIALSPLMSQGLPYVLAAVRDVGAYPRVRQALQRARYSEALAQLSREAVDVRDPQPLLQRVPAVAAQALEAEQAAVLLLDAQGRPRLAGAVGGPPAAAAAPAQEVTQEEAAQQEAAQEGAVHEDVAQEGAALPPDAAWALARGEPLLVADLAQERRFPAQALAAAGLASVLAVPVLHRGRALGLLLARARRPGRFGADELQFLQSLSHLLASTLQRAHSEEALQHAQRLESVGQLTGGIAHDFNNLLTVIHGNLQVLQELPAVDGDATARQLAAAAARACVRGAELTGKLLAFSRRQRLQPRPVAVEQLLASLADMLRRTLDPRIRIEVDAPGCPEVLVDPGQLESALLNIAINARDAMPEGGRLRFSCRACERLPPGAGAGPDGAAPPPAGYVAIAVRDSGPGMPEAVRDRAFEPFFTTKPAGRGTGLGLSTVYGFATQSRGAVTLASAPGAGTTVTLFLPQAQAQAAAAPAAEGAAAPGTLPPGLRVLLVEDDAEVREVMRSFLLSFGCRVTACASAEEALAAGAEAADAAGAGPAPGFELLLSDVALGPGLRGPELAARAAARWPGLAVLLMSGYPQERSLEPAGAVRDWPLLRKPCSREQLRRAMAQALQGG